MLSSYRDLKTIGQVMEEAQEKTTVHDKKIERRKKENVEVLSLKEKDKEEEEKIATWRKAAFGFGNFSRYTVLGIQAYFLNPFLLEVAGISAFWAGTIQLIKQVYDGITDPMVGRLSDRIDTRWGRRKPWIIAATVPSGILWILQWYSPEFVMGNQTLSVLYYTLILLFFSTANTFVSVPYNAMVPDITSTYHDRTQVVMFQEVFGLLSIILFSFIQAKLVEYFPDETDPSQVDYQKGYFVSSWLTVWAVVIPMLVSIMFVSEKKVDRSTDDEDTTGKALVVRISLWFWFFIKGLLKALMFKEFTLLVITFVCSMLAVYMVVNNFVLYAKYVLGIEDQTAYLMLVLQSSVTISFFFWAILSRLIGKRLTFFIGSVIWIGGSIIVFFIDKEHIPLFYGITCLRAVGSGVGYLIPLSILPDLIEIDRVKNGQQREGILYSLMILLQKTGVGVGLMFSNYILQFAGYESLDSSGQEETQPDSVLLALRFLFSFVPVFFIVIANISLLFIPQ